MNTIRVERIFRCLDTNESGSLSRSELVELFLHTPGASETSLIQSVDRLFDQAVGNHKLDAVTLWEFVGLFTEFEKREGPGPVQDTVIWFESMLPYIPKHGLGVHSNHHHNQWAAGNTSGSDKSSSSTKGKGSSHGKKKRQFNPEGFARSSRGLQQQLPPLSSSQVYGGGTGGYGAHYANAGGGAGAGGGDTDQRPGTAVKNVSARAEARRAQWRADKEKGVDPAQGHRQRRHRRETNPYGANVASQLSAYAGDASGGSGSQLLMTTGAQVRAAAMSETRYPKTGSYS